MRYEGTPVDLSALLEDLTLVDFLLFMALFGMFVLGYIQGTIRRLLGIGAFIFSFLFAANAAVPLGEFLATYWTQYPAGYPQLLAFVMLFIAAAVSLSLVIQGTYQPAPLLPRWSFVDELLGGLLGIIQGLLLLAFVMIILDSYFLLRPQSDAEIAVFRSIWATLDPTMLVAVLRDTLNPFILWVFGLVLPDSLRALYPEA
jgi:uncharacterized membrane protein required for colicin V production